MKGTHQTNMNEEMQALLVPTESTVNVIDSILECREQKTARSAVHIAAVGVVIFLAVVFNILVIVAYRGRWRKSPNLFLIALAIMDIFNALVLGTDFIVRFEFVNSDLKWYYYSVRQSLVYAGGLTSASLVLCVTIDRFVRIGKSQFTRLTKRKCGLMILSCVLASVLVSAPFAVMNVFKEVSSSVGDAAVTDSNADKVGVRLSEDMTGTTLHGTSSHHVNITGPKERYFFIFHFIVCLQFLLAFSCILVLNIIIIYVVLRNGYRMSKHSQHSNGLESNRSTIKCSYTPSETDSSHKPQPSDPVDRTEFQRRLSTLIAKQAANLDRRPSHILTSLSAIRHRTPLRTFLMLVAAVILFLCNTPPLIMNVLKFVKPSVIMELNDVSVILLDLLHHSYFLCLLGNPLLYTFFNRGFLNTLQKACCCKAKRCTLPRKKKPEPATKKTVNVTQHNPRVWYPTYNEIQTHNYNETAV